MLIIRTALSLPDVEDPLSRRDIEVSHEAERFC